MCGRYVLPNDALNEREFYLVVPPPTAAWPVSGSPSHVTMTTSSVLIGAIQRFGHHPMGMNELSKAATPRYRIVVRTFSAHG
jgi:hypothetical protein